MISTASRISAASTKTPMRKRMLCSFMAGSSRAVPRQLGQPFPGLPLDELAHARIGTLLELSGRAIEENLVVTRSEARQRVEHHNPIGHLGDGLHVVGDHNASHGMLPARL